MKLAKKRTCCLYIYIYIYIYTSKINEIQTIIGTKSFNRNYCIYFNIFILQVALFRKRLTYSYYSYFIYIQTYIYIYIYIYTHTHTQR